MFRRGCFLRLPDGRAMRWPPMNERMALQLDKAGGAKLEAAQIIDEGPWPLADLAQLFKEQNPNVLASCWAAILLDALIEAGLKDIASIARSFNVVAVKLNHRPKRG